MNGRRGSCPMNRAAFSLPFPSSRPIAIVTTLLLPIAAIERRRDASSGDSAIGTWSRFVAPVQPPLPLAPGTAGSRARVA